MENSIVTEGKAVLEKYLQNGVFSAAAAGWYTLDCEGRALCRGFLSLNSEGVAAVDRKWCYDLASLTKILVTVPSLLLLVDEGVLSFRDELNKFYKAVPVQWSGVKLFQLLNHSSGMPAHRPWYAWLHRLPRQERFEAAVEALFAEKPLYECGDKNVYSDLGYILLGDIVERVSGLKLAQFWSRRVRKPLQLSDELLFSSELARRVVVPVGRSLWNGEMLSGVVHDDNCRLLGGMCGHAGLFGTVTGVVALAEEMHRCWCGGEGLLNSSLLQSCIADRDGERRCGFDTPSRENPSCGSFFSPLTIGHLGFTGTSVWMDLEKGCGVVLLTNRVIAGEDLSGIKALRTEFHDAVMKVLSKKVKPLNLSENQPK